MLSSTVLSTLSTWGRWESVRSSDGLYAESRPMSGLMTPSKTKSCGTCEAVTRSEKEDSVLRAASMAPSARPPTAPTRRTTVRKCDTSDQNVARSRYQA